LYDMNSYQRKLSTQLTVPTILLIIQAIALLEAGVATPCCTWRSFLSY